MKIALIIENFDPARGGAERSVAEMASALADFGHQVTIVAGNVSCAADKPVSIAHVKVASTKIGAGARWRAFEQAVGHYLEQTSFDMVHSIPPLGQADVYQPRGGCIAYNADRHAESFAHPLAVRWKRLTARLNSGRTARIKSERMLCKHRSGPHIVAVSHYVEAQFAALYGLDESRVTVISNGIDTARLQTEKATTAGKQLRAELNLPASGTVFLFAAEEPRLKGLGWLVQSVQQLGLCGKSQPPFTILLIGNPRKYAKFLHTIERDKLAACFRWVGSVPPEQMPNYYCACDAVVLPTYHDACSRVILEGLAAGKPAITTRYNGACDFLENEKTGIILPETGDPEALGAALVKLSDVSCRQDFTAAVQCASGPERLSMQRHVQECIELYEKIAR